MIRVMKKQICEPRAGFSLIELIGVIAIMAIMAGVLVPNVLKTVDRAAVVAEQRTAENLGTQLKMYVRRNPLPPAPGSVSTMPAVPAWATSLAQYSDLSSWDVTYNRRQQCRIYLTNASAFRAIILSSMRAGLALPASVSAAQFQQIWDTPQGRIPPVSSWAGWTAWTPNPNSDFAEYLIVQRIDLRAELQTLRVSLNNTDMGGAPFPRYELRSPLNVLKGGNQVLQSGPATLVSGVPGDLLLLFDESGVQRFSYIYAGGEPTFGYNGINWTLAP
jgi:prepilin-type N-terminal cleavage/methylation domain-containing protein